MMAEEVHEFLILIRLNIEENAHPPVAASSGQ